MNAEFEFTPFSCYFAFAAIRFAFAAAMPLIILIIDASPFFRHAALPMLMPPRCRFRVAMSLISCCRCYAICALICCCSRVAAIFSRQRCLPRRYARRYFFVDIRERRFIADYAYRFFAAALCRALRHTRHTLLPLCRALCRRCFAMIADYVTITPRR